MRIPVKQIIFSFKQTGSVGKTASLLGLSRPTIYRWLKRARTARGVLKWRGLKRKSTKPKTIHYKLVPGLTLRIVATKEIKHFGAKKLKGYLKLSV